MIPTARNRPFDPVSARTRRWLIIFCGLMLASFIVQTALGAVGLWAIFDDRGNGIGDRTVSCATLYTVSPAAYARLPECAGIAVPPRSPGP